jgi:uncharacterized protein YbcI
MSLCAIVFEPTISFGNIVTAMSFLVFAIGAFVSLRERSTTNALMVTQIKARLDGCGLEQMKERVDTMWIFQLRRGLSELEQKGLGKTNSPMRLTKAATQAIEPLREDLKKFYEEIGGDKLGIVDLAVKIEQSFGHRIAEEVCNVCGVTQSGCLILAIAMLRPVTTRALNESTERSAERVDRSMSIKRIETPHPVRRALLQKEKSCQSNESLKGYSPS